MTYKDIRDYIDKSIIVLGRQSGRSDSLYLAMLRDAIDKQIAKKPLDKKYLNHLLLVGLCPCCEEGANEAMKFCSECGQKLDWSDV